MNEALEVPGCRGVSARPLTSEAGAQVLRVDVAPGGEIPLHQHACAATMVIISGEARTLGKDGRVVRAGDVVVKKANEPHGFTGVSVPFSFISISTGKGILREDGWDLQYH